jgi:hypothetical protein
VGSPSRSVRTARPDQDGRFKVSGLPPGEYFASAVDFIEPARSTTPNSLIGLRRWRRASRLARRDTNAQAEAAHRSLIQRINLLVLDSVTRRRRREDWPANSEITDVPFVGTCMTALSCRRTAGEVSSEPIATSATIARGNPVRPSTRALERASRADARQASPSRVLASRGASARRRRAGEPRRLGLRVQAYPRRSAECGQLNSRSDQPAWPLRDRAGVRDTQLAPDSKPSPCSETCRFDADAGSGLILVADRRAT